MRNILLCFLFVTAMFDSCFAQPYSLNKDTSQFKNHPIFLINSLGKVSFWSSAAPYIDPLDIATLDIPNRGKVVEMYGEKAKNGVIIISLKPGITLITIKEILEQFHIPKHKRSLPIFLDSTIVHNPLTKYFGLNYIRSVKIQKEKETGMKYISLLSTHPIHRLKPGEAIPVSIRGADLLTK